MSNYEETKKVFEKRNTLAERQINSMANHLAENGYSDEEALMHAKNIYDNGGTFSDLLMKQGELIKFANDSVKVYGEEEKEVPLKGNIKSKQIPKEKIQKKFKKIVIGVLMFSIISGMVVVGIDKANDYGVSKKYDEISAKTAYLNENVAENLQEKNIVTKNKYLDAGEVEINYDGIVEDIGEITLGNPALFETQVFKIYDNIADVGTIDNHETDEVITSVQLENMDIILDKMKSTYPEGEVLDKICNCDSFVDYVYKTCAEKDVVADVDIYNRVTEYNELKVKDVRGYPYSHLERTEEIDELLRMYRNEMNKEVADQIEMLEENHEYLVKKGR